MLCHGIRQGDDRSWVQCIRRSAKDDAAVVRMIPTNEEVCVVSYLERQMVRHISL